MKGIKYTVIGSTGFIGSEIVKIMRNRGYDFSTPSRDDDSIYDDDLGCVIYTAGAGDCENDRQNVIDANFLLLNKILNHAKFEKIIYVSSTRLYMNQESTLEEDDLKVCGSDNRRLFNLTKLLSEELLLKSNKKCLIVRPSNVYGVALNSPLFLPSIIRDALNKNTVNMYV